MMPFLTLFIAEIFQFLTLIKIAVAVIMAISLSVLAEKVSTRFAGIVSGFPLGAAISLFFIGYEVGPLFAAQSAAYMIFGLIATMFFVFGYYIGTGIFSHHRAAVSALLSALGGLLAYFAAAVFLQRIKVGLAAAALFSSTAIIFFSLLFRRLENVRIEDPVRLSPTVYFSRAAFAAAVVVLVTALARFVGPAWAGLLSAFPVTLLPFVVIVHATYRQEHVRAILKNIPRGLGALVAFGIAIGHFYPLYGIVWGTIAAYLIAGIYLVAVSLSKFC
jgi:hypothetical protein